MTRLINSSYDWCQAVGIELDLEAIAMANANAANNDLHVDTYYPQEVSLRWTYLGCVLRYLSAVDCVSIMRDEIVADRPSKVWTWLPTHTRACLVIISWVAYIAVRHAEAITYDITHVLSSVGSCAEDDR